MVTEQRVLEALKEVKDPELGRSLVDLGMVRDIKVAGEKVRVSLALTTLACPLKDGITASAREAIMALPGVFEVEVNLVAMSPDERDHALGKGESREGGKAQQFNHIGQVVAVMSGKGGVGKSLVTGLLAVALARDGKKVGILDADVTGPSIPKMFGLWQRPEGSPMGILPVPTRLGIRVMSINLLLEREDEAVIWRGPLIAGTVKQFWEDVVWGDLDYLLVDLPPGTGDVPLTVMQSLPVAGVIIVSTPQDLASMVVRKAVRMVAHMDTPMLGVVENMSYFVCPDTGKRHEIFGPSHGEEIARMAGVPFLGQLPINPEVAHLCDAGLLEDYESEEYRNLARAFMSASPVFAPASVLRS
jgi:Mrp family chromosome partitioning ATPase